MTEENLLYRDPQSFSDLTLQERENLRVVMEELKGWDTQNVDRVLSVMAKDAVYHDITLPPAKGWEGIRKFGEGWVKAAPDFHVVVEKFVVQGENVVNMGRISATIKGEYLGLLLLENALNACIAKWLSSRMARPFTLGTTGTRSQCRNKSGGPTCR